MEIVQCKDYDELSIRTADFVAEFIKKKPDALLCFPAGHTSLGTFQYLAEYAAAGKIDFGRCKFVGLDEWLGLDKYNENNCRSFMYKHLFRPLKIEEDNIAFFDIEAENMEMECKRIDAYIARHVSIDLMILGIGMNGHLGLNEPGVSFELYSHVVDLNPVTQTVGQKYFDSPVKLEKGISLGLRHVMETGVVILQASGKKKAQIIKKAVEGPVTTELPASILKQKRRAFLFIDREAASLITE